MAETMSQLASNLGDLGNLEEIKANVAGKDVEKEQPDIAQNTGYQPYGY